MPIRIRVDLSSKTQGCQTNETTLVEQLHIARERFFDRTRASVRTSHNQSFCFWMLIEKRRHATLPRLRTALDLNSGKSGFATNNKVDFFIALAPPHNLKALAFRARNEISTDSRLNQMTAKVPSCKEFLRTPIGHRRHEGRVMHHKSRGATAFCHFLIRKLRKGRRACPLFPASPGNAPLLWCCPGPEADPVFLCTKALGPNAHSQA